MNFIILVSFQVSALVYMSSSLFWVFMQCWLDYSCPVTGSCEDDIESYTFHER